LPAAGVEAALPVVFEPADVGAAGHGERFEHLAGTGVDAPKLASPALDRAVPQVAFDEGDAGDEAIRGHRAKHFPWASSFGSDFNADFSVWFTEEQQFGSGFEYNYRHEPKRERREGGGPAGTFAAMCGVDTATYVRERPGMSAFAIEYGVVHHAYSTYARGLDGMWGAYQWLDRAPKGRNETNLWWKRHDEYDRR
jgi:Bacterial protein of unknown function (DUF899)